MISLFREQFEAVYCAVFSLPTERAGEGYSDTKTQRAWGWWVEARQQISETRKAVE